MKHKAKINGKSNQAYYREYRRKNKELHRIISKRYADSHKEQKRLGRIKWKYGITKEEYQKMVDRSGGKCEACGVSGERLGIDHSHITGKIRGLLCKACNLAAGHRKDSPERLTLVAAYIMRVS